MENFQPGEVVLVAFPFASTEESKRRPALVLIDIGDADIVAARVTSQAVRAIFDVQITHWQEAGLLLPSVTRIHKLATLEKRLIERRLGKLEAGDWAQVLARVRQLWAIIEK